MEPDLSRKVSEVVEIFQAAPADVKWVDPQNLHLTLKFLGDVDSVDIHRVCEMVEKAAAETPPFEFEIRGAGAFPTVSRPRTFWLGAGEGRREMVALAKVLEKKLQKLGFPRESRSFQPHLTIGRLRRGGQTASELSDLLRQYADVEVGRMAVAEVTVFSSTLTPSGPIYDVLSKANLRA